MLSRAVDRNRVRRSLREVIRNVGTGTGLLEGLDIVVRLRRSPRPICTRVLRHELEMLVARL
jgi:ribonuclease P protein component